MKRHWFNLLVALSLLLCVATMLLWVRSYQRQGWVGWTQNGSSRCYALTLGSFPGRLGVVIEWQAADATPLQQYGFILLPMSAHPGFTRWSGQTPRSTNTYDTYAMTLPQRADLHQFAGLAWYADHSYTSSLHLLVPHRYLVLVAAAVPLCWMRLRYRAMRRARRNACVVCGYDLRATPDRCPECGAVPEAKPTIAV